jgi:hypothetical protein
MSKDRIAIEHETAPNFAFTDPNHSRKSLQRFRHTFLFLMNALSQLISKISRGASLNGDDMIALLLVLTMIASLTHLLTMLATQWGDRNTTTKSLLASILVHGVCFLGLEVFEPSVTRKARAEVIPPKPPETVTEILVESDQDVKLPESGNTPIADMMTETGCGTAAARCHIPGDHGDRNARTNSG